MMIQQQIVETIFHRSCFFKPQENGNGVKPEVKQEEEAETEAGSD